MSEYRNDRIQEFSLNGSHPPRIVAQFEIGSRPVGIASCGDGTQDYIVSLSSKHQVTRISGVDGRHVWTVGAKGREVDNLYSPFGVTALPNGRIAIADYNNRKLHMLDVRTGGFIKQIR